MKGTKVTANLPSLCLLGLDRAPCTLCRVDIFPKHFKGNSICICTVKSDHLIYLMCNIQTPRVLMKSAHVTWSRVLFPPTPLASFATAECPWGRSNTK